MAKLSAKFTPAVIVAGITAVATVGVAFVNNWSHHSEEAHSAAANHSEKGEKGDTPNNTNEYLLTGTVRDAVTSLAIVNANVLLVGPNGYHNAKNTDDEGLFSFKVMDEIGDNRIQVSAAGYKAIDRSIARRAEPIDIRLEPLKTTHPSEDPINPGSDPSKPRNRGRGSASRSTPIYDSDTGHYYELVDVPQGLTWDEAKQDATLRTCKGLKGHLATISDEDENAFIVDECGSSRIECKWLGAYKTTSDPDNPAANWTWVTGEPWKYANWASGEPGSPLGEEENALIFKWTDTGAAIGTWNDMGRNKKRYQSISFHGITNHTMNGYIVEYE